MIEEDFRRVNLSKCCWQDLDHIDMVEIEENLRNLDTRKTYRANSRFHILDTQHVLAHVGGQYLFHCVNNTGEN